MSPPRGLEILGMSAAIHIDFAKIMTPLVKHDHFAFGRNDLERVIGEQHARHAKRLTCPEKRVRIGRHVQDGIRAMRVSCGIELCRAPRRHWCGVARKFKRTDLSGISQPDAREVWWRYLCLSLLSARLSACRCDYTRRANPYRYKSHG